MSRTGSLDHELPRRVANGGSRVEICLNLARDGVVTIYDQDDPKRTAVWSSSAKQQDLKVVLEGGALEVQKNDKRPARSNIPGRLPGSYSKSIEEGGNICDFLKWLIKYATQSNQMLFRFLVFSLIFTCPLMLLAIAVAGMPAIAAGGVEVGGTAVAALAVGLSVAVRRLRTRFRGSSPGSTNRPPEPGQQDAHH
jgi:hypothetical protein